MNIYDEKDGKCMKELKIFEHEDFGSIRVFKLNDEFLFVGKDIAEALGYADPKQAIRQHCKYLKSFKGVKTTPLDLHPNTHIITESDVYRLIFNSQLPGAEKFQDWVMDEVLPSIRKHGMYVTEEKADDLLSNPDRLIEIFTNYKMEQEQRRFAEEQRQLAEGQRDEAMRTKAWISDKKTATAMNTASVYSKQNDKLRVQIGDSRNYKQVKAIPWLGEVFDLRQKSVYSQVGKHLKKICDKFGYDYRLIEDSKYGHVKAYHVDAIEHFRHKIIEDELLLNKYRKDFALC